MRIAPEHSPAALASSLSAEDMVIADAILRHELDIEIFTLDTERLHSDTLNVIEAIRKRYGYGVRVYRPNPKTVGEYVVKFGRDAFYESMELRKRCCHIRKVEPLARALEGKEAWITGQRREQAATRAELNARTLPAARFVLKHTARSVKARLVSLNDRVDVNTFDRLAAPAGLAMNDIAHAALKLVQPLFVDPYGLNRATGSFILIDEATNQTMAAGMIDG